MNDLFEPGTLLDAFMSRGIIFQRSYADAAEIRICCPFCFETRFRLGINLYKDVAHCFNCSWRTRKAVKDISDAMDLGILQKQNPHGDAQNVQGEHGAGPALPDDFMPLAAPPRDKLDKKALKYLKDRGVTDWQIKEKKIGVSFIGRYAYRVIFPVYYGKKLKGIVSRDFTGKQEPKYLNSSGDKGIYNAQRHPRSKAVLCEGVFDCLALERVLSNYDVLALLGNRITPSQEDMLDDYNTIVLWPDADKPGMDGFFKVGKQLMLHHYVDIVPPSKAGKDAGDMAPDELAYMWAGRTRLTESVELKLRAEAAFSDE